LIGGKSGTQMIFFKACPKCHGDLHLDRDMHGVFVRCLQCGFMKDIADEGRLLRRLLVQAEEKSGVA